MACRAEWTALDHTMDRPDQIKCPVLINTDVCGIRYSCRKKMAIPNGIRSDATSFFDICRIRHASLQLWELGPRMSELDVNRSRQMARYRDASNIDDRPVGSVTAKQYSLALYLKRRVFFTPLTLSSHRSYYFYNFLTFGAYLSSILFCLVLFVYVFVANKLMYMSTNIKIYISTMTMIVKPLQIPPHYTN